MPSFLSLDSNKEEIEFLSIIPVVLVGFTFLLVILKSACILFWPFLGVLDRVYNCVVFSAGGNDILTELFLKLAFSNCY